MDDLLATKCRRLHEKLTAHPLAWPFHEPVDPVVLNLPTYFDIVAHPMDLRTMKNKLLQQEYVSPEEYKADMILMFENAIEFNKDDLHEDSVANMARKLLSIGLQEWEKEFSDEPLASWEEVATQVQQRLIQRAKDERMIARWKRDSFVARMNREKLQRRQAIAANPAS